MASSSSSGLPEGQEGGLTGEDLVAQRMAQAPPLLVPAGPPKAASPVAPGFVEAPQPNQHGSGAPAQAGGEAAGVDGGVEATGEREERPRKTVKSREPSPGVEGGAPPSPLRAQRTVPPPWSGPSVDMMRQMFEQMAQALAGGNGGFGGGDSGPFINP